MKFILIHTGLILAVGMVSCSTDPVSDQNDIPLVDSTTSNVDSLTVAPKDTVQTEHYETVEETYVHDHKKKQWDFCDCIYKTDSIDKAINASENLTEAEFEVLMARFELIDQHCKTIIASPNTTPRERKAHEAKVRKCKKELGLLN